MVLTSTTVLHFLTCVWSGPVGEPGAITGYKHTPVNRGQSHLQATALSELTSTQRTVVGQWQCGCNALHILLMPQFAQNSSLFNSYISNFMHDLVVKSNLYNWFHNWGLYACWRCVCACTDMCACMMLAHAMYMCFRAIENCSMQTNPTLTIVMSSVGSSLCYLILKMPIWLQVLWNNATVTLLLIAVMLPWWC